MRTKTRIATAALAALALSLIAAKHVPKLSADQARKIALEKVAGDVKHEELEKEHGRWIYSFEIHPAGQPETDKSIREVNVDSDTGEIVSVETEKEGD